jgi:hypothetical protein
VTIHSGEFRGCTRTDAYAQAIGRCKPELGITKATKLARDAFAREGDWNNPKVCGRQWTQCSGR